MSTQQKEFDCFFFPLSVLFFHMSVTIVLSCVMSHAGARCRPETKAYSSHCYKPSSTTLLTLDRHAKSLRLTTAETISLAFYTTQKIVFYQLSKLSIYLSIYLSLSIYPSIHASIHISLSLSVCLSVYLSVCLYHVRGISYETSTSALSWKNCRVSSTR